MYSNINKILYTNLQCELLIQLDAPFSLAALNACTIQYIVLSRSCLLRTSHKQSRHHLAVMYFAFHGDYIHKQIYNITSHVFR